jgi:hypothetical protein
VADLVVIPVLVRTPPASNLNAERGQTYSKVFFRPKVLEEAFPWVRTKVSSATSDPPRALSSCAEAHERGALAVKKRRTALPATKVFGIMGAFH